MKVIHLGIHLHHWRSWNCIGASLNVPLPLPCSTPLRGLQSDGPSSCSYGSLFTDNAVCWLEAFRESPIPKAPSPSSLSSLQQHEPLVHLSHWSAVCSERHSPSFLIPYVSVEDSSGLSQKTVQLQGSFQTLQVERLGQARGPRCPILLTVTLPWRHAAPTPLPNRAEPFTEEIDTHTECWWPIPRLETED